MNAFKVQQWFYRALEFLANPIISILVLSAVLALMYVVEPHPFNVVVAAIFIAYGYFTLWLGRRRSRQQADEQPPGISIND